MSTANPKITVATVTYNAVDVIERTLESVEEQDYPHVEHIIVDGNSHDGTIEAVMHYQERGSREGHPHEIAAISEPDRGIYDAMNKALKAATGDFIVFLNAGDKFPSPTTLSSVAALIDDDTAVIYGDTDIVDNDGRFIRHRRLAPPPDLTSRSFLKGMLVCHQAFFARLRIARRIPYNLRYRFSADYDWCIRVMRTAERAGMKLRYAGSVTAPYLDGGMTVRNHRRSLMERFMVMTRLYGLHNAIAMHLWFIVRAFIRK